jgi:hypothetical protein
MTDSGAEPPRQPFIDSAALPYETDEQRQPLVPPATEALNDHCYCRPDQTPWAKYLLELTALLVVVAYTIAAYRQLGVMGGQLTEMQGASSQTDQLISAAKIQAQAATKFAQSAENVNQQMRDAVDQFNHASNAQLQAMTRQLSDFENSQVANLTIEELAAPDWPHSGRVSYKLFNRGNSLARNIGYRQGQDAEVVPPGSYEPDWVEVKREMQRPFELDPNGGSLAAGQFRTYEADVNREPEKVSAMWVAFIYLDIFGKTHRISGCYWYQIKLGNFGPCYLERLK